jgi:hypothetical protein
MLYALLAQFLVLPLMLALRYPLAIQFKRGGVWRLLSFLALRAGLLDIYLNYTTFTVLFLQLPREGEYTLSKRCERLVSDPGWRGKIARMIAWYTNKFDEDHIPQKG